MLPDELQNSPTGVSVGCFAAFVIEEARLAGFTGFAAKMEDCFAEFLRELPKEERKQTLHLSYLLQTAQTHQERPKLRLVYSRA